MEKIKIKLKLSRNLLITIVANIIVLLVVAWGIYYFFTPKIGHVRTSYLVQNFTGMKEAQKELDKKKEQWQKNLDTLALQHDRRLIAIGNRKPSPAEEEILARSVEQYNQYMDRTNKMSQDEEIKLMSGVINQITSKIDEYAKTIHYDYILGTTELGSLLYSNSKNDITDDLLKYINSNYEK